MFNANLKCFNAGSLALYIYYTYTLKMKFIYILFLFHCTYGREKIHIGAFLTDVNSDTYCFKSAMTAALELINGDESILPHHELVIHFIDVVGTPGFGIQRVLQLHKQQPVLQVLLGPFVDNMAGPIRQVTQSLKLPHLVDGFGASESRRKALIKVFQHFGWKDINILYDYENFKAIKNADALREDLSSVSMTTSNMQTFSSFDLVDTINKMQHLKDKDARIITADMLGSALSEIFCAAYLTNMNLSKHVFVSGGVDEMETLNSILDSACTPEQVYQAADGFITLSEANFRLDGKATRCGKSPSEVWELIKHHKNKVIIKNRLKVKKAWGKLENNPAFLQPLDQDYFPGSSKMFDHVYRVALTFDELLKNHDSKDILMESYLDEVKYKRIIEALQNTEFEGVTGRQQYSPNSPNSVSGIERDYHIKQLKNGSYQSIGYFTSSNDTLTIFDDVEIFKDNIVPRDRMLTVATVMKYQSWLTKTIWSITACGIVLAVFFYYVNNQYKHKRMIKMSSPNINNIIIVGCLMCYVVVILYGMDATYLPVSALGNMCNVNTVLLSIGFTLSFGGLFSKTWRVYKIYSAASKNKKVVLRDHHLYCIIFSMLIVDALIIAIFLIASPFELHQWKIDENLDVINDVYRISVRHYCNCKHRTAFVSTIFSFKTLLLVFGLFMAWETRNVDMPILNDSKQIGIAVYTVSVVSVIGTICTWALNNNGRQMGESYFMVALSICLCTTITLLLVFVPKITLLYNKDRERRRHSLSACSTSSNGCSPALHTKITKNKTNVHTLVIREEDDAWRKFTPMNSRPY